MGFYGLGVRGSFWEAVQEGGTLGRGDRLKVGSGAIVEDGDVLGGDLEVSDQDLGHCVADAGVCCCESAAVGFVGFGERDEGVFGAEFEGEDGVAEVVPIYQEGGAARGCSEVGEEEGRYGRGVLHEEPSGFLGAVSQSPP